MTYATRLTRTKDLKAFVNAKGSWRGLEARLVRASGRADGDVMCAVQDGRDLLHAFGSDVVDRSMVIVSRQGTHRLDPGDRFAWMGSVEKGSLLTSGRSMVRFLEVSASWHSRQPFAAQMALSGVTWEAGLPDATIGGFDIRVLLSGDTLVDEGSSKVDGRGVLGLSHCVAGYAEDCRSGYTRIVSVTRRTSEGVTERVSTAQFAMAADPDGIRLVQHKGRANARPKPEEGEALATYLHGIRTGGLPFAPVTDVAMPRVVEDEEVILAREMQAWRPYMPKSMWDWSPSRMVEAMGMRPTRRHRIARWFGSIGRFGSERAASRAS